jgi:hypothetical protein
MARFTTTGGSGDGTPGAPGADGQDGADALWNYTGEYSGGAAYAVGDIVTYDGQLWYRYNANGGNVGDTPSPGLWNLLAAKGADGTDATGGVVYLGNYVSGNGYITNIAVVRGSDNNLYIAKSSGGLGDPVGNTAEWDIFSENTPGGSSVDIADFVFTNVDASNSSMTITGDKEMTIESGADSDLNVRAGDQLWLTAGNDVILQADDNMQFRSQDSTEIMTNFVDQGSAEHVWEFTNTGTIVFPDATIQSTAYTGGAGGDLVIPFIMKDENGNDLLGFEKGGTGVTRINALQDDLALRSSNDIILYPGDNGPGNVYINWGDATITPNATNRVATIGDIQELSTGDITFYGVQIIGAGTASGDGSSNGTIELIPDADLITNQYHEDQYLIIDPTAPNHIHIRAGGVQDASTADLFLGAERNNVKVSDPSNNVTINTRPYGTENTYGNSNEASNTQFIHASTADIIVGDTVRLYTGGATYVVTTVTQDSPSAGFITVVADGLSFITGESYVFTRDQGYNNQWTFGNDGVLSGPAMGGIWVESISKKSEQYGLGIYSPVDIVLDASNGEFLNDSSNPANQIATIGNINDTVSTGMVRYSPTFTATGLAFTGSGATHPTYNSYYVKAGNMVTFAIEVDCDTVTNFGTGQFKLQLPFTPAVGFNHFSGWAQVDTAVNPDVANGHVILNVDHAGITDILDLHYLKQAGGAHTPIIEGLFLQGTPVTLTTSSKIYVNGTYIADLIP